jgi:ZIP family zinc transporter
MNPGLQFILRYTAIPALAILVGGTIALFRVPTSKTRSVVQHFAAGVVFAAVAAELLPQITHEQHLVFLTIGFLGGVGAMLGANRIVARLESGGNVAAEERLTAGLLIGVAVDVFVDGLLVGASFAAGSKTGVLITLALTLELLFLGLAASATLRGMGRTTRYTSTILLVLAFIVLSGAAIGGAFLTGVSGALLVGVLSFATAALLYLVTEELLAEAHNIPDTALATTMFFLGFLGLLVIDIIGQGR